SLIFSEADSGNTSKTVKSSPPASSFSLWNLRRKIVRDFRVLGVRPQRHEILICHYLVGAIWSEGREYFRAALAPLFDRNGTANEHDLVIWCAQAARHYEMEMESEKTPSQPAVKLWRYHAPEPDLPNHRVTTPASDSDADVFNGIQIPKIQNVSSRLTVNPCDIRIDSEAINCVA